MIDLKRLADRKMIAERKLHLYNQFCSNKYAAPPLVSDTFMLDAAGSLQFETELELGRTIFTAASGNSAAMEFISVDDPSERFVALASGGLELYDADGLIRTASRIEN